MSLTYNIGAGWMKNSTLSNLLKSGTYTTNELASAIGIWCHVTTGGTAKIHDGLVARRISEINVFLYGDYSGEASGFYCVRFESDRGSVERDVAFYECGSAFEPYITAEADDDTFVCWRDETGAEYAPGSFISRDLTLTAVWQSESASDWG